MRGALREKLAPSVFLFRESERASERARARRHRHRHRRRRRRRRRRIASPLKPCDSASIFFLYLLFTSLRRANEERAYRAAPRCDARRRRRQLASAPFASIGHVTSRRRASSPCSRVRIYSRLYYELDHVNRCSRAEYVWYVLSVRTRKTYVLRYYKYLTYVHYIRYLRLYVRYDCSG